MTFSSKQMTLFFVLSLAVLVGIAGCDSEVTSSDSSSGEEIQSVDGKSKTVDRRALSQKEIQERLQDFAEKQDREGGVIEQKVKGLSADHDFYRNFIIDGVVDGDQYECGPTPLDTWADNNLVYSSFGEVLYVLFYGIDQYPYLYNLLFVNPRRDRQQFGANGEYTRQVFRTDRSIKRFWDVNLRDVQVESFSGSMLKDFDKVFRIVEVLYPTFSEESNRAFAQDIVDVVVDGSSPVWSFNAFAFEEGPILVGGEDKPDQIQMGDGILDGMDAIGLGDAAPQGILAHEFGHQIQYELNVFENDTTSDPVKATRRTELMADAFAAYYLGHKRGAAFNWDRVEEFMLSFFNVGDCGFANSGHHGTPNQRMKAAQWGFDLAENAPRRMGIISASEFVNKFDAALPDIVAPDAGGS